MRRHLYTLWILGLLLILMPLMTAAQSNDTTGTVPALYGDSYTPEELAAIDRALWAANMTREDMTFKKDYTEGYGCFPVVKEMMHDPLTIAPFMDRGANGIPEGIAAVSVSDLSAICDITGESCHLGNDPKAAYEDYSPKQINTIEDLLSAIDSMLASKMEFTMTSDEMSELRAGITSAMAWHDFEKSDIDSGYNESKEGENKSLYELANTAGGQAVVDSLMLMKWCDLTLDLSQPDLQLAWPSKAPVYHDTPLGQICIGTPGDDYYEGDFVVLIDPGGNDTYHNCRIGAAYGKRSYGPRLAPDGEPTGASADYSPLGDGRFGYFLDLGGDDFYDCADVDITLGAAVLGVAAFYDLGGGDDRYYAGSCSLGAAMGGIATFYDDGGCDYYSGKVYTQGAAGFGIGIMVDDSTSPAPEFDTAEGNDAVIDSYETGESDVDTHNLMDNDTYTAWANAQAFARPRGVALCINRRGNETYYAGGVYLDAPLFSDRYQSFSQGFAIGERGIDWAGGIAMLIDYSGNDKYLGDIYDQGVGYWYGAGLLWDGGGNDMYEMTQYGQGSGIHLAIGGLIDVSGNDTYVMHSGLGQSGSHDLAASVLQDRGGDDRYDGNTSCNGSSLTGSVAIFLDRSGNDTYAGKHNSINVGDNRRINIGLFCDLDGTDDYMAPDMADNTQWTHTNIGMGLDIMPLPPPEEVAEETVAAAETEGPTVPIPEICHYEGELTQDVFDQLWEIACRWEVGDNRQIVPVARQRLIDFGADVLPYMSKVMNESNSGLAYRAYVDIFKGLHDDYPEQVYAVLCENAESGDSDRETAALYLTGQLKYIDLEDMVIGFLDNDDPAKVRRAVGVLGSIGSHSADDRLIAMLDPAQNDEPMIKVAVTTLTDLEVDCYPELSKLLDYPLLSVRGELIKQLAAHWDVYGEEVEVDLSYRLDPDLVPGINTAIIHLVERPRTEIEQQTGSSIRYVRSLLDILSRVEEVPNKLALEGGSGLDVWGLLSADDWGVRADAVQVVRHWQELAKDDEVQTAVIAPLVAAMDEMLADETDPYVLFAASGKTLD